MRALRDAGPKVLVAAERLPALSAPTGSPARIWDYSLWDANLPQAARIQLGYEPASSLRVWIPNRQCEVGERELGGEQEGEMCGTDANQRLEKRRGKAYRCT